MFLLILSFFVQGTVWALSPDDVLQKVREASPEVARLEQLRDSGVNEAKAIRRWLNPEFASQSLFSKVQGESRSQIQLSVLQPIEFGARAAYKAQASEALEQKAKAEYELGLSEALIQTGRDLYRLQQLKQECSSIHESLTTYEKLIQQYRLRPKLSPEQEVSLSVYQLSRSDFLLRDEKSEQEELEIYARLKTKLDLDADVLRSMTHSSLNLLNQKIEVEEDFSPKLQVFDAEFKTAESQLSLERAEIFSQILVGPMIQFDSDGSQKTHWYGLQLNFPLPIWNQNGSGVQAAVQQRKASEISRTLQTSALWAEVKLLRQSVLRYQNLLKQIPSASELESKHRKVETQIYRGLVSSALVVESHRSMIEIQRSRHETEMSLLVSLWKIYQIQGKSKEIHL